MKTTVKHHIYIAINKVLLSVLVLAILGIGGYAIHLTRIHATVTIAFGDKTLLQETQLAAAVDQSTLNQFKVKK